MAELLSALFVVLVKGCTVVESRKLQIFPGGGERLVEERQREASTICMTLA